MRIDYEQILAPLRAQVQAQGDIVRKLKSEQASEFELKKAISELKLKKKILEDKELELAPKDASFDRSKLEDLLKQKFFFDLSFAIYGGVQGLYDYGPMGCAMKSNLLAAWRHFFVLEEQLLEVDCSMLTPEPVLRASGHVERFTDLMVKDIKTGECFRADHLVKAALEARKNQKKVTDEDKCAIDAILAQLDNFGVEAIQDVIQRYDLKSPITNNDLTEPQEFNLMFSTSIGPTGQCKGYLRPETAQGIFVNFQRLLHFNQGRLPFGAAQIGNAFRNEISPRSGLIRVREFTMAEIEYFVDPNDKMHPKFDRVSDIEMMLLSACDQMDGCSARLMTIGEAVSKGIVANQTLGYYMARIHLFLIMIGVDPDRLRFRQHMSNEMAHYACDCWDAECQTSYGWIECVGCADRSCYDLTQHTKATGTRLVAEKALPEPRTVQVCECVPAKSVIGKAFRADAKTVVEHLSALTLDEATSLQETLKSQGKAPLFISGREFVIEPNMVQVKQYETKIHVEEIVPSVIEPSFGIGRLLYTVFEHSFRVRDGDEQRTFLAVPPILAPYKCSVLPLSNHTDFVPYVRQLSQALTDLGVSHRIDESSGSIGRRYARTDQIAIPYGITIDFDTVNKQPASATLRERDSMKQIRVPLTELPTLVDKLSSGLTSWESACVIYPLFEQQETVTGGKPSEPPLEAEEIPSSMHQVDSTLESFDAKNAVLVDEISPSEQNNRKRGFGEQLLLTAAGWLGMKSSEKAPNTEDDEDEEEDIEGESEERIEVGDGEEEVESEHSGLLVHSDDDTETSTSDNDEEEEEEVESQAVEEESQEVEEEEEEEEEEEQSGSKEVSSDTDEKSDEHSQTSSVGDEASVEQSANIEAGPVLKDGLWESEGEESEVEKETTGNKSMFSWLNWPIIGTASQQPDEKPPKSPVKQPDESNTVVQSANIELKSEVNVDRQGSRVSEDWGSLATESSHQVAKLGDSSTVLKQQIPSMYNQQVIDRIPTNQALTTERIKAGSQDALTTDDWQSVNEEPSEGGARPDQDKSHHVEDREEEWSSAADHGSEDDSVQQAGDLEADPTNQVTEVAPSSGQWDDEAPFVNTHQSTQAKSSGRVLTWGEWAKAIRKWYSDKEQQERTEFQEQEDHYFSSVRPSDKQNATPEPDNEGPLEDDSASTEEEEEEAESFEAEEQSSSQRSDEVGSEEPERQNVPTENPVNPQHDSDEQPASPTKATCVVENTTDQLNQDPYRFDHWSSQIHAADDAFEQVSEKVESNMVSKDLAEFKSNNETNDDKDASSEASQSFHGLFLGEGWPSEQENVLDEQFGDPSNVHENICRNEPLNLFGSVGDAQPTIPNSPEELSSGLQIPQSHAGNGGLNKPNTPKQGMAVDQNASEGTATPSESTNYAEYNWWRMPTNDGELSTQQPKLSSGDDKLSSRLPQLWPSVMTCLPDEEVSCRPVASNPPSNEISHSAIIETHNKLIEGTTEFAEDESWPPMFPIKAFPSAADSSEPVVPIPVSSVELEKDEPLARLASNDMNPASFSIANKQAHDVPLLSTGLEEDESWPPMLPLGNFKPAANTSEPVAPIPVSSVELEKQESLATLGPNDMNPASLLIANEQDQDVPLPSTDWEEDESWPPMLPLGNFKPVTDSDNPVQVSASRPTESDEWQEWPHTHSVNDIKTADRVNEPKDILDLSTSDAVAKHDSKSNAADRQNMIVVPDGAFTSTIVPSSEDASVDHAVLIPVIDKTEYSEGHVDTEHDHSTSVNEQSLLSTELNSKPENIIEEMKLYPDGQSEPSVALPVSKLLPAGDEGILYNSKLSCPNHPSSLEQADRMVRSSTGSETGTLKGLTIESENKAKNRNRKRKRTKKKKNA